MRLTVPSKQARFNEVLIFVAFHLLLAGLICSTHAIRQNTFFRQHVSVHSTNSLKKFGKQLPSSKRSASQSIPRVLRCQSYKDSSSLFYTRGKQQRSGATAKTPNGIFSVQRSESDTMEDSFQTSDEIASSSCSMLLMNDDNATHEPISNSSNITMSRNIVLTLTVLVATLSALDRVAMSVAILPLAAEYGLSETDKGQISSVFSIGYGLGIVPAGILVSFTPPKLVMAYGVLLWSLATLGTPMAASYMSVTAAAAGTVVPLLIARTVMGMAESVVLPTIQRILLAWVPPDKNESSVAVASVFAGFQLGTILAYSVSPDVIDLWGSWRGVFYMYGAIGVIWLIPWALFAKDSPSSSEGDRGVIDVSGFSIDDEATTSTLQNSEPRPSNVLQTAITYIHDAPLKTMFASKGLQAMTIAHAANNWGLYNTLAWAPTFYQEQYHLNVHDSSLFSVLPSVAGALGGLFAGAIADRLLKRGADRTFVRKLFQGMALFGPAVCLSILTYDISSPTFETTPFLAQLLLTGTVGLQAFNAAGYGASAQEKAGDKWAGLLYSITSLPGVLVGSIAVYATGEILDATGQDWSIVFGLNVLVDLIGALCFVTLYDSNKEFD